MKKIKKNHIIITALAILIAVAGYINYSGDFEDIISVKEKNAAVANSDEVITDGDGYDNPEFQEPGTVILTSGKVSSDVISAAKLNREQARAINTEALMKIINDTSVDDDSKTMAINQLALITACSEKECAAEILLEAKGFNDCVVAVSGDNVDVVVNRTELDDVSLAQIEDIVKRKTGFSADKITINVCNNQ